MENNILDEKTSVPSNLGIDAESVRYLKEGRGWAMFLAILGFVGIGFIFIAAIAMFVAGSVMSSQLGFPGALLGVAYLILGALWILPVIYLFSFAQKAGAACKNNDTQSLSEAIKSLRTHFKIKGIMYIIMIALYIIIIFVAVAVGLSSVF